MDNLADYKLSIDPLKSFIGWYDAASICEQNPTAMTLSTYDVKLNRPDARTVLFKGMEEGKLVFYTNYKSAKGLEIEKNNEVCLLFYWHESKRQVRIHGRAQKMSEEKSAQYFQSRDRESQLASWTSQQSQPIESKESLEKKLQETSLKFKNALKCQTLFSQNLKKVLKDRPSPFEFTYVFSDQGLKYDQQIANFFPLSSSENLLVFLP